MSTREQELEARLARVVAAARAFERDFAPPEHEVTASCFELRAAIANEPSVTEQRQTDKSSSGDTFEQAWARMEALGYRYGADALEQVRFGWELARGTPRPKAVEHLRELRSKAGVV